MKLELTKEQVGYFKSLDNQVDKKKFLLDAVIENLEADLNREKTWYETTKEDVEAHLSAKQAVSGNFLDEFTGVLSKMKPCSWESDFTNDVLLRYVTGGNEVPQLDYEILSFKSKLSDKISTRLKENNFEYKENLEDLLEDKNALIYSVKRLSDGEVFTVGEDIDFGDFGNKGFQNIARFEIDYFDKKRMTAYNGPYGIGLVKWQKSKPTPLFNTEDGVAIYKGDIFFAVQKSTLQIIKSHGELIKPEIWATFSTTELAEQYILMNKSCLSLNDLLSVWGGFEKEFYETSLLFIRFKKLAKSKL